MNRDQYFMTDKKYLNLICDTAELTGDDVVLEVGTGLGYLTEHLAESAGRVISYERDRKVFSIAKKRLAAFPDVELILGDALKEDWPKYNKIVSNIPYSISRELTQKFIRCGFETAVVAYQREYVNKLNSKPAEPGYRFISVFTQFFAELESISDVPPTAFEPRPGIYSTIVKMRPKNPWDSTFEEFIRRLFNLKNKKIKNILELEVPQEFSNRRPIELTPEECALLFSKVNSS